MKILHLCLGCFYIDNYSYQENLLPKYHQELGYKVEIIASLFNFDVNGKPTYLKKSSKYKNEFGIPTTRLSFKKGMFKKVYKKLKLFQNLDIELEKSNPDIIFIHGCQFVDIQKVVKYIKKNKQKKIRIYVDNHADFSNSANNWLSKNILHGYLWKRCAQLIEPYTEKFYGVLPARVDFLVNIYKLPKSKVELLVMGADDEEISKSKLEKSKKNIRKDLKIKDDEFFIITG